MAHGNLYDVRQKLKIAFLAVSLLLVALFLIISNRLVEDLSTEEHNKMEIWAEATRSAASNVTNVDMNLILKILQSNTTIPLSSPMTKGKSCKPTTSKFPTGTANNSCKKNYNHSATKSRSSKSISTTTRRNTSTTTTPRC